ncbi:MAG: hypothetical protein ABSE50_25930 [Xanthobacteraceae bacterium]
MTSESDSTPGRRPPTIDLTATEVGPEKPPESEAQAKDEASPSVSAEATANSSRSHLMTALAGGAAGAIAIAAIIAGLQATGHWPVREGEAPVASAPAAAPNEAAIADLTAQINKIQSALSARQPDPALVSRLASVEATTKSLGDSLNTLTSRVDQVATAAQGAQAQAKSAADVAGAAKTSAQGGIARGDLDALTSRIAALESTVKSLSDSVSHQAAGGGADDGAARLIAVAEALRTAVERGTPFQTELAAVKTLGADQTTLTPLEPFAASGVPSAEALARELATLAPALTEAVEPKTQSTFLDRIEVNAQRLVRSTPLDAPAGDDPGSVAMRISFNASHGDIDAALTDIAKLPDAAKSIAASWVQKAQARNAAIAASLKLTADALAALSKPQ